jgi:hypothetical protein
LCVALLLPSIGDQAVHLAFQGTSLLIKPFHDNLTKENISRHLSVAHVL